MVVKDIYNEKISLYKHANYDNLNNLQNMLIQETNISEVINNNDFSFLIKSESYDSVLNACSNSIKKWHPETCISTDLLFNILPITTSTYMIKL